jgi:SnoaL-like domain
MRPHAGQAPPYSVENSDMHIYILGDTAVTAYVRTYKAKENGNVSREDTTHIFVKDHGAWKLKVSRASIRAAE